MSIEHSGSNIGVAETGHSDETEQFNDRLRVSILGGSFSKDTSPELLEKYRAFGATLNHEGVTMLAGPLLDGAYTDQVAKGFLAENETIRGEEKPLKSGVIEIIPSNRSVWLRDNREQASSLTPGEKSVHRVDGGLSQLTASLERPTVGVHFLLPPSETSAGTMAEAMQIIAQTEVVIKTNQTAAEKPENANPYPLVPKLIFVGWPEAQQAVFKSVLQRSSALKDESSSTGYNQDLVRFVDIDQAFEVAKEIIPGQKELFRQYKLQKGQATKGTEDQTFENSGGI